MAERTMYCRLPPAKSSFGKFWTEVVVNFKSTTSSKIEAYVRTVF
jgi:hypothetical protein